MRVAYLTLQATDEGQAAHAHVHEIIGGLRAAGMEVELFAVAYHGARPSLARRALAFGGVQRRLMARLSSFDVVYVRWHFAAGPTAIAGRLLGVPVVQEVNGPYEDLFVSYPWTRGLGLAFRFLGDASLRLAAAVVAVTPELATWVRERTRSSIVRVIPNAANVRLFHPKAVSTRPLPRDFVVFIGALSRWQGVDTLLEAVRCDAWPESVQLLIAGDGTERDAIIAAGRASDRLRYLGSIPYAEVPGILASSIASLVPKTAYHAKTGLAPLKVYEALACGVPVVASRLPGLDRLIDDHRCGLLIEPGNGRQLAEAVATLYGDRAGARAMGARGRAQVEAKHSWEARSRVTVALLRDLRPGRPLA